MGAVKLKQRNVARQRKPASASRGQRVPTQRQPGKKSNIHYLQDKMS